MLPYVLAAESLLTLPTLEPFLTDRGCRPNVLAVVFVLSALTPPLLAARLAFTKAQRWHWLALLSIWVVFAPVARVCQLPQLN